MANYPGKQFYWALIGALGTVFFTGMNWWGLLVFPGAFVMNFIIKLILSNGSIVSKVFLLAVAAVLFFTSVKMDTGVIIFAVSAVIGIIMLAMD